MVLTVRDIPYRGPVVLVRDRPYYLIIETRTRPGRTVLAELRQVLSKYFTDLHIYSYDRKIIIIGTPRENLQIWTILPVIADLLTAIGILLIAGGVLWTAITHPWILVALFALAIGGLILYKELKHRHRT